jgi:DNA invertase Pin-like site-specific DNA recombinase
MKAFGYVRGRVNSAEGTRQENHILAYAQANRIELAAMFRDELELGVTEENDCPALSEMLRAMLAAEVWTIIVDGVDRLSREPRVQASLLIGLGSKGIAVISAATGQNVSETLMADPVGKALLRIHGIFAALEKSRLVTTLRQARERQRERQGRCEGRKSLSEIFPQTVEAIRQLRRKVPGCKRLTDAQVAAELNDSGLVTASGKAWNRFHVQNVRKALHID